MTQLVTTSTSGSGFGDKTSTRARISESGSSVVFQSAAKNLTTTKGGGQHVLFTDLGGTIVPKGNHTVVVDTDATTGAKCKTKAGTNGASTFSEVSNTYNGDGPWVVFASNCYNLVSGWTHVGDVYIKNMRTGVTKVVSQANGNDNAAIARVSTRPVISDNGRYVAWNSTDGDVFVRDMWDSSARRTVDVVRSTGGDDESLRPEISGDGSHIIFASDARLSSKDTNSVRNIYVVDLRGWESDKSNTSFTPVLADVTSAGTAAPRPSSRPGINGDGMIVSFQTNSPLVSDDKNGVLDAYWRNMSTNQTVLLSRGWAGDVPKGQSSRPQLDDSGYVAAFTSTSNALVKGDTNGRPDAFLRRLNPSNPAQGTTYAISQTPSGNIAGSLDACSGAKANGQAMPYARPGHNNIATRPYLSGDGNRVVFVSGMCDLTNPPTDGSFNQIYVRTYGG
ncbi:hypothetical protein BN12_260009 [Nostocoides japonicum T1-X7]|uniref:WD40 domain protein beta Propeller n=1 Tax=Nostocoides japonicum T1-X7 TaxID=1194083 RepID=A0A077LWW3_9MICO|nr:hypothetical protein [Tetrasphaera japonica]CCH78161.1 hypothetical protein BN12_260009 [Tetrasphaera japonica T1-X7]